MRLSLPLLALAFAAAPAGAAPPKLNLLFLGDNGHHRPADRFAQLKPAFAARNIALTYTDKLDDLNPETLAGYDGLIVYANHEKIAPEQEQALLDYVASGKGFIPVHCASYCFLNSPRYIALVGAQFRSHGTGTFRTEIARPDHPLMKDFGGFASWDETYVHTKHNEAGRTVLEVRTDGDLKEPWTWVRTEGKGRVFYTAWGHDHRTWGHPGFQNLLERGVRWACRQDPAAAGAYADRPKMTDLRKDVAPFEYVPAKVPFYPKSDKWGVTGDPIPTMQKPLSVAESLKHYVHPVGFELKPFVTEEKLGAKPICMTWDERGRLWLALTVDYPNELQPPGKGRDRIVVCEDADGDGVCDAVTTFAENLSIPTSLLPYAGGLIVHQAPVTLFLKDTDGDGKADVRQELFRGWATNDTHAGPSNLRYGFDNWVYGSVGYAGYRGTVNGEALNFRQGYYRFKVEPTGDRAAPLKVAKLEFLRSTNNNTWGLAFDEAGELFGSTANGCPLVHLPIPNRYYEKVRGLTPAVLGNIAPDNHYEPITDKVRQVDWHGGFTSAANCAVYTARTYPPEYWNKTAFVSDPTGHLTATFVLQPAGATYTARYGWNLVASDDEWAAPIDAQVGPDGHVWVLDWYNFIVQHNPTPAGFQTGKGAAYETDLRDKTRGRVYRLVYTKAKPEARVDLKDAPPEKLVETLKHPNLGWRLHAQRLLIDRGQRDVLPALQKLVADRSVDAAGLNPGAVHAVWALAALGGDLPADAAKHPSAAVRLAALLAPARAGDGAAAGLRDPDPGVRLAALLALADAQGADAGPLLAAALADPGNLTNPALRDALTIAAAVHAGGFVPAALARADRLPAGAARVVELAARNLPADALSGVVVALSQAADPAAAEAVVAGLAAGAAGKGAKLSPEAEAAFGGLLTKLPAASRGRALKLGQAWGVKGLEAQLAEIAKGLLATVADPKAADAARVEAARQVVEFRPDDGAAAAKLLEAVTADTPPAVAAGLFEALAASQSKAVGPAVVARLKDLPAAARPAALRLVLAKPDSAAAFLDAVEKGTVRFDLLALDQKTALAGSPDRAVAERARKLLAAGGGLPNADRQKVIEELLHVVKKDGDPANGKKVYMAQCGKCHQYAGEGTAVGPDLTGMAVHPKEELLIHILDPSRSVEGNYKAYRAVTLDGRTVIGLLASESRTAVELVDAEGKRHAFQRDDLEALTETDKSLMPEGFEKQVSAAELTDLLTFMTRKGKYVPLPLDKVATVVTTKGMFFDPDDRVGRLVFPDWKPKVVDGVPFVLVDPQGDKVKNAVMLYGPNGKVPPTMPKAVTLPLNARAKALHLLSGVGGWNFPYSRRQTTSMTVRLHYDDGTTEDHALRNGVHFADYIDAKVEVPGSKRAFDLNGRQVRYLKVEPKRDAAIRAVELVKGPDDSAPIVMALTAESP
jgi:putative membrane-bound dehydrogenase-like protein